MLSMFTCVSSRNRNNEQDIVGGGGNTDNTTIGNRNNSNRYGLLSDQDNDAQVLAADNV